MAYTSYNATRLPHIYLMHTTLCHRFGVGIRYPDDTGDSFLSFGLRDCFLLSLGLSGAASARCSGNDEMSK